MLFSFLNVNDCLKALLVSGVCFYSIFLSLSDLQPQCPDGLLPGSGKVTGRSRRIPADTTPEGQGRSPWQRPPWDHHCCHSHQLCAHQHLNKTLSETCPKGQFVLNNDQWHHFIMIKKVLFFPKTSSKELVIIIGVFFLPFFMSFPLCLIEFNVKTASVDLYPHPYPVYSYLYCIFMYYFEYYKCLLYPYCDISLSRRSFANLPCFAVACRYFSF